MPTTPTNAEIVEAAPNYAAAAAKACARAGLSLKALEAGVVADLLAACEMYVRWLENEPPDDRDPEPVIRAAIAKARG